MKQVLKIMSIMVITMAFTISCSSVEELLEPSSSSTISSKPSSSSIAASSSSSTPLSSSSAALSSSSLFSSSSQGIAVVYGDPVTDVDGQIYETVVIGTQTWMKRNLNRNVDGSKCYSGFEANCNIYGRLYDWETAMDGAASSYKNPSEVQGICPEGFHVPSDIEWAVFIKYVEGDTKKLRAVIENGTISENGTDDYGFSALLAGYGEGNSFSSVGSKGYSWSATAENGTKAFYFDYTNSYALIGGTTSGAKSRLHSLRCVKDGDSQPSSSSYTPMSCPNIPAGSFCDDRDGKSYKSTTIGNHVWMAENLNYKVEGGFCYGEVSETKLTDEEAQANCDIYGRLYNWRTAVAVDPICNFEVSGVPAHCSSYMRFITSSQHQGVCPKGWHLPTEAEKNELIENASGASNAGQILKASSGWDRGNGVDALGFSALPGGRNMEGIGISAGWWYVIYGDNYSHEWGLDTGNGVSKNDDLLFYYSIRCVQDSD